MRATSILRAGAWNPENAADSVLLDFDMRHRRRITLGTEGGAELVLDLPHATRLRGGDGLALDAGGVVLVRAKPEPLLDISAPDPAALARIA